MKTQVLSEYDIQAAKFVESTGITIDKVYTGHRKHFEGDTQQRSCWNIVVIAKGRKSFSFDFGNSLVDSYKAVSREGKHMMQGNFGFADPSKGPLPSCIRLNKKAPSDYSLLACISSDSYETEGFEYWCDNFGYDIDSRKALDLYLRCEKISNDIGRFFTSDELDQLREIQ
jgi:hypothetical protein